MLSDRERAELAAELTPAILEAVLKKLQLSPPQPGTVQTIDADGTVAVVLDVDKDAVPQVVVRVKPLDRTVAAEDRVLVSPHGFVIGVMT